MSSYEDFCGCGEWSCKACHGPDAVPESNLNAHLHGAPPSHGQEQTMSTDRTDTDRLNWLVEMGYVEELRRRIGGRWTFLADSGEYTADTFREVIDKAMDGAAK